MSQILFQSKQVGSKCRHFNVAKNVLVFQDQQILIFLEVLATQLLGSRCQSKSCSIHYISLNQYVARQHIGL